MNSSRRKSSKRSRFCQTNSRRRRKLRKKLLIKYGHSCVYCSESLSMKTMTIDHLVPVSHGGSDWFGNLLPSCRKCNQGRENKPIEQWLRVCEKEGLQVRHAIMRKALQRASKDQRCFDDYYRDENKKKMLQEQAIFMLRQAASECFPSMEARFDLKRELHLHHKNAISSYW